MSATEPTFSTLCRHDGRTCGACCWGSDIDRAALAKQLARNRRLFHHFNRLSRPVTNLGAFLHELRVRRGLDLLLAPLLWLPIVSSMLRRLMAKRIVCAFAAFESGDDNSVGCLLHPKRCHNVDLRQRFAFRLLHGFRCGSAEYFCDANMHFRESSREEQANVLQQLPCSDWFNYSNAIAAQSRRIAIRHDAPTGGAQEPLDLVRTHNRSIPCR